MINYIITSIFLSLISWVVYICWVRSHAAYQQQKQFIYLIIAASLCLPLLILSSPVPSSGPHPSIAPLELSAQINPIHLQQYCKCKTPNYSHRITYRANGVYNFLLHHKSWLNLVIFSAIGLVLLSLAVQLGYLYRLVRRAEKKPQQLDGKSFVLLQTPDAHPVGAFWLGRKYIIWQEEMHTLSASEQKAIFLHELSHLEQGNTIEKAALKIVQCLWLINPVFYFFRRELDLISECIADECGASAFRERRAYARLLIKLKEFQSLSMIQCFKGNSLKIRVSRLLDENVVSHGRYSLALMMTVLLTVQVGIVLPVSTQVDLTIREIETYEEIYHKVDPGKQEAIYCQDCETVCKPDE